MAANTPISKPSLGSPRLQSREEVTLRASVETRSGRIRGCKRGSWVWWHEKGHLQFAGTVFGKVSEGYGFVAPWALCLIIVFGFDGWVRIGGLLIAGLLIGEEVYADWFAAQNFKAKEGKA